MGVWDIYCLLCGNPTRGIWDNYVKLILEDIIYYENSKDKT
jgi:DNA-directed RNA polymerase subunit N (RpoN/RPB10)